MDRKLLAIAFTVVLCGCQAVDRPTKLTRATDAESHIQSEQRRLPSVEFASAASDAGHEPPEPDVSAGSDQLGSRHIVPVGYQIDGEILPPAQPSSNLTLPDLESMALQNSPALAQAAAQVRAARGNWVQVGLPPNVRLGYSGEEMGDEGSAGRQGGFIAQEFVTGHKLRLNREIAAWEIQRLERDFATTRLRVLTDVRVGFYNVLIAQRRRELAVELVRVSKQGVQAAEALFKSDEVSEADPLRARVEADTAGVLLQNAINEHIEVWRRLSAVLGMPDLSLERIDGDLDPDEKAWSWEEQLQRVLSESPELAAALTNVESARWAVERAQAEVIPNWTFAIRRINTNLRWRSASKHYRLCC